MLGAMGDAGLRRELASLGALEHAVRERLYSVGSAGTRALAVSALAAAAAERAYARSETVPESRNETSDLWHAHLADVWGYLEGDLARHRALSTAIADFLVSPLNHTDGQDGPDDFDRPQTIAGYSAVASVVLWGVDFATTAVAQLFELIDLEYDGDHPPGREDEVRGERHWVMEACTTVVSASSVGGSGVTPTVLARLRQRGPWPQG